MLGLADQRPHVRGLVDVVVVAFAHLPEGLDADRELAAGREGHWGASSSAKQLGGGSCGSWPGTRFRPASAANSRNVGRNRSRVQSRTLAHAAASTGRKPWARTEWLRTSSSDLMELPCSLTNSAAGPARCSPTTCHATQRPTFVLQMGRQIRGRDAELGLKLPLRGPFEEAVDTTDRVVEPADRRPTLRVVPQVEKAHGDRLAIAVGGGEQRERPEHPWVIRCDPRREGIEPLQRALVIEYVPSRQAVAQRSGQVQPRQVGRVRRHVDPIQASSRLTIGEPAPGSQLMPHRALDPHSGDAGPHDLSRPRSNPVDVGSRPSHELEPDVVALQAGGHERRRHRLGAARVVGHQRGVWEAVGQLPDDTPDDQEAPVQVVRRDLLHVVAALIELSLRGDVGQVGLGVGPAALDDHATAGDLLDGSLLPGGRIPPGAKEADMRRLCRLNRLQNRFVAAADGAQQDGVTHGFLCSRPRASRARIRSTASASCGRSSSTTLQMTSRSSPR